MSFSPRGDTLGTEMTAFKALARVLDRLDRISSSSQMLRVLAGFLPALTPAECRMTAYLCSGRAGPSYSSPEFGMGERLVEAAIADACGVSAARVRRSSVAAGDPGLAIERLGRERGSSPPIAGVFETLASIARIAGTGAQERKVGALAELLRKTSGLEAKYIVRTLLGSHRVGVAELTFLHALCTAFGGTRAAYERAFNALPDLGEIAERAARGQASRFARARPKPGSPVRMMLATRVEDLDQVPAHLKDGLFVEYKYDGERVQIHRDASGTLRIFSRRLEEITHQYPEVLASLRSQLRARTAIIEGEVVAVDRHSGRMLPFQRVMQRKRRRSVERYAQQVPVVLFCFDAIYLNGKSLLDTPLAERKRLLAAHLTPAPIVRIGEFVRTNEITEAERYFHRAVQQGAEGVVVKSGAGPYEAGKRGWNWIKFKKEYDKELADTFDLVVVGALRGKGSRAGRYGSLLAAAYDPQRNRFYSLTKVGAGITDAMLRKLPGMLRPYRIAQKHRLVETNMKMDVWFEPICVIEISGADLTVSPVHTVAHSRLGKGGIALRFPRLLRLREDKTAEQATTVQEIWNMYVQRERRTRARRAVAAA